MESISVNQHAAKRITVECPGKWQTGGIGTHNACRSSALLVRFCMSPHGPDRLGKEDHPLGKKARLCS